MPLPARTSRISAAEFELLAADAGLDEEASRKKYGGAVSRVECRYLGVAKEDGSFDPSAPATPESQLAFEFLLHTDAGPEVYLSSVKCKKALKGKRLVPPQRCRKATPVEDIQAAAETHIF